MIIQVGTFIKNCRVEKENFKIGLKSDVNMKPKSDPLIDISTVIFEDLLYNKIFNTKVI